MKRRLAFVFVLSSVFAGCSLLVEFDRGKLGPLDGDATTDATADVKTDSPAAEGGGDVTVTDTGTDVGVDAGIDAPEDAPPDVGQDTGQDAGADTGADTGQDAGQDTGADTGTDAGQDANDGAVDAGQDATISLNCTQAQFNAEDHTGSGTFTINFPETTSPAQYTPNCIKVSVGTVVTFHGNFGAHPLQRAGGSPSSPIPVNQTTANDAGDVGDVDVTFTAAGEYDFECGVHGVPGNMFGSVQVVP